jgi:hypothetical protein
VAAQGSAVDGGTGSDSSASEPPPIANDADAAESDATVDGPAAVDGFAVDGPGAFDASAQDGSEDRPIADGARADSPPESSPPDAACTGSAPTGQGCAQDSECGRWGLCAARSPDDAGLCCGKATECCSNAADCCSGDCLQGACTSEGNACLSDADCNDGAACVALGPGGTTRCFKLPGTPCGRAAECLSNECAGGRCGCLIEQACRSQSDCCTVHEHCIVGQCRLALEGESCVTDADCGNGVCMSGQCRCLPAGSMTSNFNDCCSGGWSSTTGCTAQGGGVSHCSSVLSDCFGGACEAGTCACVGPGGNCNVDSDCCAGAARCAQFACQ